MHLTSTHNVNRERTRRERREESKRGERREGEVFLVWLECGRGGRGA
jgi:hypothetical protein